MIYHRETDYRNRLIEDWGGGVKTRNTITDIKNTNEGEGARRSETVKWIAY